jgi:diacylglycerol kinase (ATP)
MTSPNTCDATNTCDVADEDFGRAPARRLAAAARPAGALRLLVIHNPTAGWRRRRRLRAVLEALADHGCAVTLRETTCRGDAETFARAARAEDYDRVVVAGGDGTINEAINGLLDRRLPVAVVPMGTANVLAAEMGLRARPRDIAAAIVDGMASRVVLGRLRGPDRKVRRFSMMAGIGFDAHVVARVNVVLKRWTGKFAYVAASLAQLVEDPGRVYDVVVDGRRYRAASAIVAKGHFYGGRFVVAPAARLDQPDLHVCLFRNAGRLHVVRYALALMTGQLHRLSDVTLLRARRVEIAGPAGEPVQVDGDLDGQLPVVIDLDDEALQLAMPAVVESPGRRLAVVAEGA